MAIANSSINTRVTGLSLAMRPMLLPDGLGTCHVR